MVRAALAAIETRVWTVQGKPLAGAAVVALYHALGGLDPIAPFRAVGACGASDRRFDRATSILKAAGLIRFSRERRRWERR